MRPGLALVVLIETKLKGKGQETSGEYVHIWSGLGRNHKPIHQCTNSHGKPGFQSSILDYCITRQKLSCKLEDVKVFRGWKCGTDHFMLQTKILFPWKGGRGLKEGRCEAESITLPKYKLYLLMEDSVGRLYRSRLEEKLDLRQGSNLSEK
ncbi:unnamed protein product [Nezara viridula]|uniref:Uncharacterized protein n=1 Tax=Nezara viridula TaxID=85310 RepID=A0A9P0H629_NEZVI|nr:unnamed protein product [Nezara viridula]